MIDKIMKDTLMIDDGWEIDDRFKLSKDQIHYSATHAYISPPQNQLLIQTQILFLPSPVTMGIYPNMLSLCCLNYDMRRLIPTL